MRTDGNRSCGARLVLAGLLLAVLAPAGTSLQAADTEYYRHYDRACVEAMLSYAWTQLVPAVQARCDAAGRPRPLISPGRWQQARDARFYAGPDGWTTPEDTAGLRLDGVLFRDADGDGRCAAAEYVWLDADGDAAFDAGEAVLSGPGGAGRAGDHGRAFPDRLYAGDGDADGAWDPGEDIWQETAAADRADLEGIRAALTGLLGSYVNHLEEPAWNGGTTFARTWTSGTVLAALGQETLLSPPAALDGSFAAARSLEAWLRQAVGLVDLLQCRPAAGWSTGGRKKSAFVFRGPYYEVDATWQEGGRCGSSTWSGPACQDVLRLCWNVPSSPQAVNPYGTFSFVGDEACGRLGDPGISASGCSSSGVPGAEYQFGITPYVGHYYDFFHTDGCTSKPWYLGPYSYEDVTGMFAEPECINRIILWGLASAAVAAPARNAFAIRHSGAAGGTEPAALTILPSATAVASLFATAWAAAEWQPTAGGEVRAYRWESDATAYWPDAHDTCISQEWQECTATLSPPAGAGVEVYVYVAGKEGAPDLFAGKDAGRFWHWSTLAAGPGGPVEFPFAPAGLPTVPDPVYPGGDYEATTRQCFTVHGMLDYRGRPGFAPLPVPPGATPPGSVFGTQGPDTDRDDLVDVGADLVSFGPDTGTVALRPEWVHPQVMIPLAVALWDDLPVHAWLCQGAVDDGPNPDWLHPDAGAQPLAFSLHSRAAVEELLIGPAVHRKIVTVVRPRGNRVAFEFAWDAAAGAFSMLGFPLAPNQRRTYVLRDLTPADDLDASFELHFDSGVIHVYAGGRLAEGALTRVRHTDGRAVEIGRLTDCSLELNANTFSSPRCHGVLTWSGGLLCRLDYTWRCGSGTLGVDLVYAATPAGPWVTGLAKTIPELGVSHAGGFGFGGGPQGVTFGSGVTVTRSGGSLTTVWPSGGALTQITTFNADGLPTRLETIANGSSHATDYHYAGGSARYSANGAPGWSKLSGIDHPDGSWERFGYDPASGWLAAHIVPWADAAPADPESLCRVTRFGYDCTLSAGDPADPAVLVERPRSAVTETLGIETARTYHAYGLEGGRRTVRTRRCAAAGADWGDAGNLESVLHYNPRGPPDLTTPTGFVRCSATAPRDDRLTLTATASSGQTVTRVLNALGQVLSYRCTETWRGFPLATAEAWSGIDPFGRPVRTDHLDGTFELFDDLQWHGGPLRHTRTDGSVETVTYCADGQVRTRSHYGVTTTLSYDALGNIVQEQRRADGLSVQTRTRFDSQGRQTLFEDELGRRTVTTYSGMDRTVIYPDGSRRHEERFLDGTPRHLSGNAVVEEKYEHGAAADGTWSCTRRRTPAGFTDASSAWTDRLGRTWQTARTVGGDTPQVMSTTFFDAQGRPCRRVDADGVTALTEYNGRNEVSRSAADLDADGRIGAADRTTAYDRQVLVATDPHDGADVTGTLRTVVAADGSVTQSFAAADGLRSWVAVNGRVTHTATVPGAGPGQRTVTTTFPDGSARVEVCDEALLRRVRSLDAHGAETASEAYGYDALRRLVRTLDGRTGVAASVVLDAAGQVTRAERSDSPAAAAADYDRMGRTTRVRQRGGGEVFYDYDPTGRLTRASGADTPPCDYLYDPRGLATGLRTWQDSLAGSGDVLTEWLCDDYSDRRTDRRLDGHTVETYRYTAAGRLDRLIRHLPGGAVTTALARDAAGEVVGISHSDGSAGVTVVRDRSGRPLQITDAAGRRELAWDRDGRIVSETLPQLPGGALLSTYDAAGRRTALTLSLDGTDLLTWTRAYDDAGRLESVSDGHCRARYEYLPGSDLVARTVCAAAGADRLAIERDWDTENRLTGILAQTPGPAPKPLASWQYTLDDDGRRIAADILLADPAAAATTHACRWQYAYDPLGQLSAAVCRDPADGAVLAGRDFAYDHDDICNRISAGRRDPAGGAGEESYRVNRLNQYTLRSVPGAVHVCGWADPAAAVTVNGVGARRDGDAFHVRLPVDNRAGPVTLAVAIRAVCRDTAKGGDLIAAADGTVRIPAATEVLTAADAGGLAADSLHACEWDANDRLTAVEEISSPPGRGRVRAAMQYDCLGRRVVKKVFTFVPADTTKTGAAGSWVLTSETVFVCDGWTLLYETTFTPSDGHTAARSYLWGLDLDGLRSGQPDSEAAQGVGGLVAVTEWNAEGALPKALSGVDGRAANYFAVSDANGSIAALVDADSDAGLLETVEYEPFGRALSRSRADAGPVPAQAEPLCPFGFSSRYLDAETGLLYFGYRYYNPDLGRWLCRDPLAEQGGPNLYAYCRNDPINRIDPLGLFGLPTHVNVTTSAIRKIKRGMGLSDAQFHELLRGAVEGSMYPDLQVRPRVPKGTPIRALQTTDFTVGVPSRVAGVGAEWAGGKIADAQTWAIGLVWGDYPGIRKGLQYWWEDSSAIVPAVDYVSRYYPDIKECPLYQTHWGTELAWQHGMARGQSAESIQSSLIEGTRACLAEFSMCASQGNMYDAGFALGKALHYLQDTHTPSHVQRSAATGLIEAFYDYGQQSPELHSKADKPDWRGPRDPVYGNAVRQTQAMVWLFLSGNADGIGGGYRMVPNPQVGIAGEQYEPHPGAVDPIPSWIRKWLGFD